MNKIIFALYILFTASKSMNYGQQAPVEKGLAVITPNVIKAQLGFLTSDWTEGRFAGEKGEYLAADYIASMLQLYGINPGGDLMQRRSGANNSRGIARSYFQNFVLLKTSDGEEQVLKLKSSDGKKLVTTNFTYNVDFTVRPSDPGMEINAPVVFAGYGIFDKKLRNNDLSKLDVRGKFVLKIAGIPLYMRKSMDQEAYLATVSETESTLKAKGAAGIIEINYIASVVGNPDRKEFLNMSPSEGRPRSGNPSARYSLPEKTSSNGFIRIVVSIKTANTILNGTGINLDEYIRKADTNEQIILPAITNKEIYLKTSVKTTQIPVRNIIGVIEGNNPDQVIVLGAHYDHMGMNNGYIWNGADDNGSGTVGVMTIARAIMETGVKPEKTIIIAFWTAEEEGLLGSHYYLQNIKYPLKNLRLYQNFDMISRYISDDVPNRVTMAYTNTYPGIKDMTEGNLKKHGIDLMVDYMGSPMPYGASDEGTFISAGIPIIRLKTVHREEYHTPMDELSTIDWDIMEKIIKISFTNVWELANKE